MLSFHALLILYMLATSLPSVLAYNCLVARPRSITNHTVLSSWRHCLERWRHDDTAADGTRLSAGELKRCGAEARTWWSNIHTWKKLSDCVEHCAPCLATAIDIGADAVTCYDRTRLPPGLSRCMLGYNPRNRTDMRMQLCNEPDSSGNACHVNPFIPGGHYYDLARLGSKDIALAEVIDVGCTLQKGVCMNWPLNGMQIRWQPLDTGEVPGD